MNGLESSGKLLMILGATLLLAGGAVWALSKVDALGRLPGDIRIERTGFTCLIPIATSILISIVLTILVNVGIRIVRFLINRGPR